jgi:hypothetical protein
VFAFEPEGGDKEASAAGISLIHEDAVVRSALETINGEH